MNTFNSVETRNTLVVNLANVVESTVITVDTNRHLQPGLISQDILNDVPFMKDKEVAELMSSVIDLLIERTTDIDKEVFFLTSATVMIHVRRKYADLHPTDKLTRPVPPQLLTLFHKDDIDINEVIGFIVSENLFELLDWNTLEDLKNQVETSMVEVGITNVEERINLLIGISAAYGTQDEMRALGKYLN